MEDEVEFSARTVDEAIAKAEDHFGVQRSDLDVDIRSQGSRGVFGIGAENARIRARPTRSTGEPALSPEPAPSGPSVVPGSLPEVPQGAPSPRGDGDRREEEPATEAQAAPSPHLAREARDVLDDLLKSMGFNAGVEIRSDQNPVILAVTGQNLGVLIGRRGDNLASLQFMVNLILSKNRRQWPRVVIDVENYRSRREESLRSLADRIAYRVSQNRRPFTLEAMPATDRRIIHLALRERTDIETYSVGEGVSRRVVIAPVRSGRAVESDRR